MVVGIVYTIGCIVGMDVSVSVMQSPDPFAIDVLTTAVSGRRELTLFHLREC
jgi:hypothetical protein